METFKLFIMKKTACILVLMMTLVIVGFGQEQTYLNGIFRIDEIKNLSAEGLNLKGKVKSVKTYNYTADVIGKKVQKGILERRFLMRQRDDLVDAEPYALTVREFDNNGRIVTMKGYLTDLSTLVKAYQYSWQDDLLLEIEEYKTYGYGMGDDLAMEDEDGTITSTWGWTYITDYHYENGALKESDYRDISEYEYNKNDHKTYYETDENGLIVGYVICFKYSDTIVGLNTYENGKIIRKDEGGLSVEYKYLKNNVIEEKSVFKIDEDFGTYNKMIYKNGMLECCYFTYLHGQTITDDYMESQYKCLFFYNKNNDVKKIEVFKDKFTFDYQYDENKNWIKRITYKNGKPLYVEEREIEYFE